MNSSEEKIIPLNIVMTYPVHWGKYQVFRDFIQNFYDSVGYMNWKKRFQYHYEDGVLSMWVEDVTFNYEWLLHIGASTKTSSTSGYAGYFGEGFKIASLCGIRDFGWEIEMCSGGWKINVESRERRIDEYRVEMLVYRVSDIEKIRKSILTLSNIDNCDFQLFTKVLDSFYYPENRMLGKKIWESQKGAVYFKSRFEIPKELPCVAEYGKKESIYIVGVL